MATSTAAKQAEAKDTVVVDLGKHKKKRIRQLRRGYGRIYEDIHHTLADLKEEGAVDANAQAVVVIVRQKDKRRGFLY